MGEDAAGQKGIELVGDKGWQADTAGLDVNEGEVGVEVCLHDPVERGFVGAMPLVAGRGYGCGAGRRWAHGQVMVVLVSCILMKLVGKVATEWGYTVGDFDSSRGKIDYQGELHYKMLGLSVSGDSEKKEFSAASISIGPGLGASVGAVRTNTISIRQLWREVVDPLAQKLKSW